MTIRINERKFKLKNKRRFTGFIMLVLIFGVFTSMIITATASPIVKDYYEEVKIKEGDTLWEIAETHFPDSNKDIREYIYEIKKLNNLDNTYIYAGQTIKLP